MNVLNQVVTDKFALYNADCREAWRREIETRKAQREHVDSGKVAK